MAVRKRALTPAQCGDLAEVPPELDGSPISPIPKPGGYTRLTLGEFSAFAGLEGPAELRTVARAHVITWRRDLEARGLSPSSIPRKLSALSLFDCLCERNALSRNPVDGIKRPMANGNEVNTPHSAMPRRASCGGARPRQRVHHAALHRRKSKPEDSRRFGLDIASVSVGVSGSDSPGDPTVVLPRTLLVKICRVLG